MQKQCVNACCKFFLVGIPSVITSDNATYFTSQLNDKFMELFGCKPVSYTHLTLPTILRV